MEQFIKNEIPVLFLSLNIEEVILKELNKYKGY